MFFLLKDVHARVVHEAVVLAHFLKFLLPRIEVLVHQHLCLIIGKVIVFEALVEPRACGHGFAIPYGLRQSKPTGKVVLEWTGQRHLEVAASDGRLPSHKTVGLQPILGGLTPVPGSGIDSVSAGMVTSLPDLLLEISYCCFDPSCNGWCGESTEDVEEEPRSGVGKYAVKKVSHENVLHNL